MLEKWPAIFLKVKGGFLSKVFTEFTEDQASNLNLKDGNLNSY